MPGPAAEIIEILWFIAGAAMLAFAAFLMVLTIAGTAFRIGPRAWHRKPAMVFAMSLVLVAATGTGVLLPRSFLGASAGFLARAVDAGTAQGHAGTKLATVSGPALGSAGGRGLAATTTRSLVLYDASSPDPANEELNATLLVNLVSHFGAWTAHPVGTYRAGEIAGYDAVLYLGAPGGATLPNAFLYDVVQSRHPVVWIDGDVEQLQAYRAGAPGGGYGFSTQGRDATSFVRMQYKGSALPMDQGSGAGIAGISVDNPQTATVLATAERADGSSAPWAVRSGNLIYVAENPLLSQAHPEGRNLSFADLLFAALDPGALTRHRALVRLEDVNPTTDPDQLRAIIDYLAGQQVPFSVGVYPVFRDPTATGQSADGVTVRLSDRPALVAALKYATAHGGSLVLHGYTHQYATKNNPNNGRSGDDAEFYLCHLDAQRQLRLDGHVPEDSPSWVLDRFDQALADLQAAGLPKPTTFEFPHYMASATDYLAVGARFTHRYERSLYFPGFLSAQPADDTRPRWQMFPYAVRDVYGTTVIPENLDYVRSSGDSVSEMLGAARSNLVVRDGVASFFYHPILGVGQLPQLVDGIRALGYTFVSGRDVAGTS